MQPFLAEALEAVWRAAGLERASAEDLGARAADSRGGRPHLLLGLGRARARHDDHFVATDADVADRNHGAFGLEGPARQLVRLGDAHDLVHSVEHLDQPGLRTVLADHAEHGARDARRPVHVHPDLDQTGHDELDLRFAGPFFHYDNHGSTALQESEPLRRGFAVSVDDSPLEPPRLVDDSFEQPTDRLWPERSFARHVAHMPEHVLLAIWLIDLDALLLFQLPDLADAPGPLVEQPDEHLVHPIDIASQIVQSSHDLPSRGRLPASRGAVPRRHF